MFSLWRHKIYKDREKKEDGIAEDSVYKKLSRSGETSKVTGT